MLSVCYEGSSVSMCWHLFLLFIFFLFILSFIETALVIVAGSSHFNFRFTQSLTFEVCRKRMVAPALSFFLSVESCSSAVPFPFTEPGDTFILSLVQLGIFPRHL